MDSHATDIYDPEHDSWATGPALPRALFSCRAVMHDGELFPSGLDSVLAGVATFAFTDEGWLQVAALAGDAARSFTSRSVLLGYAARAES